MSRTQNAPTEPSQAGADSESSGAVEGRAERIARYKRLRREELSSKYGGGAAASGAATSSSNPRSDLPKEPTMASERRSSAPSVRMTKAARLRALQISANAQAAMDPYSKVDHSNHCQPHPASDKHSSKPLDVNDNVQAFKHTASRGGRCANGTAHPVNVTDKSCKPKSSINGGFSHTSSGITSAGGDKGPVVAPRVRHFERSAPARASLPVLRRRAPDASRRTPPPEATKVSTSKATSVNIQPPAQDPPVTHHPEEPTAEPPVAVYTITTSTAFSQCITESSTPETTSSADQPKCEERRASFSETVHGILKARDDDSVDECKPRHSILKKSEERSTTYSGLHSILKRSGSEEGDPTVGVEVQSILKLKADDTLRPQSSPKPILKKHEDSRESPVEPKPILKRKSVDIDGEGKPRPILKTQQRRWSQEHEPTQSDDVIVRRRSRSTELDAKPVLTFLNEPRELPQSRGGGDCGRLPVPPKFRRPFLEHNTGSGDERKFAIESGESSSEELRDPPGSNIVAAVNVELLKAVEGASCAPARPSHVYSLDCQDTPQALSPLLKREPDFEPSSDLPSKQISRFTAEKKHEASESREKAKEFPEQRTSVSQLFLQRVRHRTVPVTADEMSAASKRETTSQAEAAAVTEDKLSKLSVADKVSLFKKTAAPQPGQTHKPRYAPAARRSNPRSLTQPVTTEEVQQAKREAEASAKEKEEGDSLSQMSLAEKLRMFNQKVTVDMLKQQPVSRSQSTSRAAEGSEETVSAPARPRAQTTPTPDVLTMTSDTGSAGVSKGILKNAASPKLPIKGILKSEHTEHSEPKHDVRGILKPEQKPETGRVSPAKPILKAEQKKEESSSSESSSSEEESEEESSSSSESESSEDDEGVDSKKILAPGTKHLIVHSPVPQKKTISNPAVQRMLNASLRRKCEDERSVQVLSSDTRLRSLSANASDMVESNKLYTRDTNQTQPITVEEWRTCSGGIAQRLEALRKSEENWRGRLKKDELNPADIAASTPVSVLRKDAKIIEVKKSPSIGDRKTWLETSSETWRQRVQECDAVQFTVAGKMGCVEPSVKDLLLTERKKRAPKPDTFSSPQPEVLRRIQQQGTPILPILLKSKSMPNAAAQELRLRIKREEQEQPRVLIPKADNETFTSFFESVAPLSKQETQVEISESAFDEVRSTNAKLAQRKKVVVKRKQQTKGNPLRALASRTDLHQEYTEVRSDVAERELQRINVEKLAKTSDLAVSALAGLASTEDFRSVQLKKRDITASGLLPNRDLALIQVKGRRHVQTRLVEPAVSSINHGDVFILVTPSTVYLWIGQHSNVIERSKASDVAASIQAKKDLHFKGSSEVKVIDEDKGGNSADEHAFFKLLGGTVEDCNPAGDPGDDLRFEAAIIDTNMVYQVEGEALVPYDKYWGMQPRFEMLKPDKALVFNFGSELYVWLGKQVPPEQRVVAVRLAEERSREGFDYSECDINPLYPKVGVTAVSSRDSSDRPNWTLLAKVNQHMEPVLFREKFLDWPDDTKLIRVKKQAQEESKTAASESELKPCDAKILLQQKPEEPDLELSGSHLGRGLEYVDTIERRHYEISTLGIKVWHTTEYEHRALPKTSYGQFHSGDTYVIRWQYMVTQTGRQLTGERSRYIPTGRERCAYFFWQGRGSTVTEQGACARLTVELDEERGPHVRVLEGKEPPCFLNLFKGKMVVHKGKREVPGSSGSGWRMYFVAGEVPSEAALVEVSTPGTQHLRSRASYVILHSKSESTVDSVYLWHGAHAAKHTRDTADHASNALLEDWPEEMHLTLDSDPEIIELDEGTEPNEFWEGLGGDHKRKQHLFHSLLDSTLEYNFTPRLFHATAVSKTFEVQEILCPWRRTDVPCAYPFLQSDLYEAQQPAVLFLDNKHEMYIWQGWWPQDLLDDGVTPASSEKVRWNTTRRLAMETALHYAQESNSSNPPSVYLVFAGLEPVEFTSLFPVWEDHDDIAQIMMKEGKSQGEKRSVQETLAELTKVHYSLEELKQDPLPEGVDPRRLEAYLSDDEFETVFECTKTKFYELPVWKQNKQKERVGLF